MKLIEKKIAEEAARADKAEKLNNQLRAELARTKELLAHAQAAGRSITHIPYIYPKTNRILLFSVTAAAAAAAGGAPMYVPPGVVDVDWNIVREKSNLAMSLLSKAAQEAKMGLQMLLKNSSVFSEVAQILKDIDRISVWEMEHQGNTNSSV